MNVNDFFPNITSNKVYNVLDNVFETLFGIRKSFSLFFGKNKVVYIIDNYDSYYNTLR